MARLIPAFLTICVFACSAIAAPCITANRRFCRPTAVRHDFKPVTGGLVSSSAQHGAAIFSKVATNKDCVAGESGSRREPDQTKSEHYFWDDTCHSQTPDL